jgi:2-aminoadipate transaminase
MLICWNNVLSSLTSARLLPLYAERKNAMVEALSSTFGDSVVYTEPEGWFFVWVSFQGELAHLNTQDLFPTALAEGVAYVPGSAFSHDTDLSNSLRLCFATSSPDEFTRECSVYNAQSVFLEQWIRRNCP